VRNAQTTEDEELDMPLTCRLTSTLTLSILAFGLAETAAATDVAVCTDVGNFTIELFDEQAPLHAANFLDYVDRGFYNGTVFHRIIEGFVVQGGGYTRTFRNKPTLPPVVNEADNGLSNDRGTLSAARTSDPDSATSQFYVNLENNSNLNRSGGNAGYTVFGRVTDGMQVIDNIAALPTGPSGPFSSDVTDPLVAVTSMARVVPDRYPNLAGDARLAALRADIDNSVAAGDNAAAAMHFNEFRAACGELGPELLLTETDVLTAIGNNAAAFESVTEYLRIANNTSEDYFRAMSLARELEAVAAESSSGEALRTKELATECDLPTPPAIPNANDATMEQMVEAQGLVQGYIEQSTEALECLEAISDDDDRSDEDRALAIAGYNNEVSNQESLAERWNTQRELFLALQE
jgi:cyclophilin family peptidyl-prolyl cis-trans isomerase